jgi:hypothetical protein
MKPTLRLSEEERTALLQLRDHDPKPYKRERAAALLQLGDGVPGAEVARQGLLRPRAPRTIYRWRDRFAYLRLASLAMRPGRGRKPAFSPSAPGQPGGRGPV